ncbi:MAG: HpcH/HpaI aldolase/citrate lyase family protein [Hyphomicrobiales bacterium]
MTFSIRPRRSVLYMPGSNARALEKAKSLDADALILDLEDAVAPDAKELAREQVCAAVKAGGYGRREIIIRVNGPESPWGKADMEAACAASPDGILVPKVSSSDDIASAAGAMNGAGAGGDVQLWAMMETPLAMLNAGEIAGCANDAGSRLSCLVMGTNDLAKETGAQLGHGRFAMLAWLSICVAAARAHGIDIVDGVSNDFRDEKGFAGECAQGAALGMNGKTLIHPAQIGPCNDAFSPADDEIAYSRKIIAAFELPENQGKGVITVDGKMTELLHAEIAKRTVAIADAIAANKEAAE